MPHPPAHAGVGAYLPTPRDGVQGMNDTAQIPDLVVGNNLLTLDCEIYYVGW